MLSDIIIASKPKTTRETTSPPMPSCSAMTINHPAPLAVQTGVPVLSEQVWNSPHPGEGRWPGVLPEPRCTTWPENWAGTPGFHFLQHKWQFWSRSIKSSSIWAQLMWRNCPRCFLLMTAGLVSTQQTWNLYSFQSKFRSISCRSNLNPWLAKQIFNCTALFWFFKFPIRKNFGKVMQNEVFNIRTSICQKRHFGVEVLISKIFCQQSLKTISARLLKKRTRDQSIFWIFWSK